MFVTTWTDAASLPRRHIAARRAFPSVAARHENEPLIELPIPAWERCTDLVRQIRRAQLRGWHLASSLLSNDLDYSIRSALIELSALQQRLTCTASRQTIMTASDVYRDLVTLNEEFEGFDFDSKACRLSVATESIVLEGVYLGPFEIQLKWARMTSGEPAYRVIAKDAHPAESRENVTHPHVMDEVLCEGDGKHGIRRALSEGGCTMDALEIHDIPGLVRFAIRVGLISSQA